MPVINILRYHIKREQKFQVKDYLDIVNSKKYSILQLETERNQVSDSFNNLLGEEHTSDYCPKNGNIAL